MVSPGMIKRSDQSTKGKLEGELEERTRFNEIKTTTNDSLSESGLEHTGAQRQDSSDRRARSGESSLLDRSQDGGSSEASCSHRAINSTSDTRQSTTNVSSNQRSKTSHSQPRPSMVNLGNELLQLAQKTSNSPSAKNLTKSLVYKSSSFIHSIKRHYSNLTGSPAHSSGNLNQSSSPLMSPGARSWTSTAQHKTRMNKSRASSESDDNEQENDDSRSKTNDTLRTGEQEQEQNKRCDIEGQTASENFKQIPAIGKNQIPVTLSPPPVPPSPRSYTQASKLLKGNSASSLKNIRHVSSSLGTRSNPLQSARRHAIQAQSIERATALSLKACDMKPKRSSSIKIPLTKGSLGPLRISLNRRRTTDKLMRPKDSKSSGSNSGDSSHGGMTSQPYELFEPPITQKTVQRSKGRGAMMSNDPRRQMSADTIRLRQLTDEYLANTGVSSSGQCSLVALSAPIAPGQVPSATAAATSPAGAGSVRLYGTQPQYAIDARLYQASRRLPDTSAQKEINGSAQTLSGNTFDNISTNSDDSIATTRVVNNTNKIARGCSPMCASLSNLSREESLCTCLPGILPWQNDVSIQCGLLPAPPLLEPYETTGDILDAIARPYKSDRFPLQTESFDNSSHAGGAGNHLSALKNSLTAISQNHISPAAHEALIVVGSIKKSLSSTLDVASLAAVTGRANLHSQDSLPAYSSLRNEPDAADSAIAISGAQRGNFLSVDDANGAQTSGASGLIGQIASKLTRQSSKKLMVSSVVKQVGLQRARSFDCRGYKRFEQSEGTLNGSQLASATKADGHIIALGNGPREHRKSSNEQQDGTLSLRPYIPQSASQVDFQVPLLPYDRMQEAIVSQRLLNPNPHSAATNDTHDIATAPNEANMRDLESTKVDVDKLICVQNSETVEANPVEPERVERHDTSAKSFASSASGGESESLDKETGVEVDRIGTPKSKGGKVSPPKLIFDSQETRDSSDSETSKSKDQAQEYYETVIVCPPSSPHITIDPASSGLTPDASRMTSSPSFSIDPHGRSSNTSNSSQLTAHDIFSGSNQLIKRPSTMLVGDGMTQMAQALSFTGSANYSGQSSNLARNRRPAIVPPKLATDPDSGDSSNEVTSVGHLIDVGESNDYQTKNEIRYKTRDDSKDPRQPRKRSGGDPICKSGSPVPVFKINDEQQEGRFREMNRSDSIPHIRTDSQATNPDSHVPSGSGTSFSRRDLISPTGLSVPFDLTRDRRRSSIAVIPQMQICPGDLLVYSKQLIDRMYQSDENETPEFLTIDDKKGKNIWSPFKLFDNPKLRARHQIICDLEDLLNALPPATFKDDQLSHYKGMAWEEFLQEREDESRRSVSTEALAATSMAERDFRGHEHRASRADDGRASNDKSAVEITSPAKEQSHRSGSIKIGAWSLRGGRGSVKGNSTNVNPGQTSGQSTQSTQKPAIKKKPELRRHQTVDSVFRIPLVPSSPMKHALMHQQTPTAHLIDLVTIEDDYEQLGHRGSGSSNYDGSNESRQLSSRPSLGKSRPGQRTYRSSMACQANTNEQTEAKDQDWRISTPSNSSFEIDAVEAARELEVESDVRRSSSGTTNRQNSDKQQQPQQQQSQNRYFMRQSSLSTLSSTITRTEQKRQRALWDLFQSECTFFFDHLLTLKNVYMEPLKKIQVEGFAMAADPDVLFGNLDELCCQVYDFCKEFLQIIIKTLKTRPEELNATDVLIKLYKENPKIRHLRDAYHHYTLSYINALNFLYGLRRHVEFVEFEKWSSRDSRCKKLQLTDLLVAPVQHIMRVPIILRDIESHTEDPADRKEIKAILAVEDASLRELDDKMRWLKNFERLLEIQKNIIWPNVMDMDPKLFVPEFLREILSKQPCEKLIVSPRRQIVHEGTLCNFDQSKACDMHVILFDDMLLLTRRKKGSTKKVTGVCKTNPSGSQMKDDGTYKYIVYKQPLSLDRLYVHDILQPDAQAMGMKYVFMIVVLNRFQQIVTIHWFSAPNKDVKQTWQIKIKTAAEKWKSSTNSSHQSATADQAGTQADDQLPSELMHINDHRRNSSQSRQHSNVNRRSETHRKGPNDEYQPSYDQNDDNHEPTARKNDRVRIDTIEPDTHQDNSNTSIQFVVTKASGEQDPSRNINVTFDGENTETSADHLA